MLGRYFKDEIWSRFMLSLYVYFVWTLVSWTQPSGPSCLWQCLLFNLSIIICISQHGPVFLGGTLPLLSVFLNMGLFVLFFGTLPLLSVFLNMGLGWRRKVGCHTREGRAAPHTMPPYYSRYASNLSKLFLQSLKWGNHSFINVSIFFLGCEIKLTSKVS